MGAVFLLGAKLTGRAFFFFLPQKRVGEWLCHEVYRKAVDVVVVLHT